MPLRPCLTCGVLVESGSYCKQHQPKKPPSPSSRAWHRPGSAKLRREVLNRDGNRCALCGSTEQLQVHHPIPVAAGGEHDEYNALTLCAECHRDAHSPEGEPTTPPDLNA